MPPLASDLRRQLENVVIAAREKTEEAARSALQKRAVDAADPFPHFIAKDKDLRNRLRARGRQVGDARNTDKTQSIDQLTQELAYEFWHRMLFARFLAENQLLMHPDGVAVSLEECEELARTVDSCQLSVASTGSDSSPTTDNRQLTTALPTPCNGFVLAARYASTMLPQIFRTDDVLLEIDFAPEQRLALEKLLASLPQKTFLADDSLGWVYQFWQSKKKDEVNKSGKPIDGRTLPAVTQLFTEHYMVQFLLHNTIGAWWCARHGIVGPPGGAGLASGGRKSAGAFPVSSPGPVSDNSLDALPPDFPDMEYLRWRDDGTPAAGTFDGWPKTLAEFTMLDPCCGSGHFLVAAFNLLVPLRMHDENLMAQQACDAVLRDNLFGLELDPRCTQIAAFALALAAWKYPDAGGYRPLPALNIACSGQTAPGDRADWQKLANGNHNLRITLGNLFDLFQKAPDLGSLIDPRAVLGAEGITGSLAEVQPLLAKAMTKYGGDVELVSLGVAAQGIAKAAELLSKRYAMIITNVPYLGRGKQGDMLSEHLDEHFTLGKADLATAFVLRAIELCAVGGSTALVTPQNWLFLTTYTKLREELLTRRTWKMVVRLGEHAFESSAAAGAFPAMTIIGSDWPEDGTSIAGVDVSAMRGQKPIYAAEKAARLADPEPTPPRIVQQADQLKNPDARVAFRESSTLPLLASVADSLHGQGSFDSPRFVYTFWELPSLSGGWVYQQTAPSFDSLWSGFDRIFRWEDGTGQLAELMALKERDGYTTGKWRAGVSAWGRRGILLSLMSRISATLYLGYGFDDNSAVIMPSDQSKLPAIWAFVQDGGLETLARELDQKVNLTCETLVKVPFDLDQWQSVADEKYPNGLPEPNSEDPTQWLFKGDIAAGTDPLQVAVARLLGYRWPEQPQTIDAIDKLADSDGILCLPGVRGEAPAAERLLEVLHVAYGKNWSDSVLDKLLTDAGCKAGTTLDDWLRNQFFEQHCKRFHNRPFLWHIWDGRKDGFSALVNYHKLDHGRLESLTYSYLGDWIKAQSAESKGGKTGADLRLAAAQSLQAKLKLILTGEPPYDIFVRWKPLAEQAMGWNPDLNDGVRMNIRPFVEAGILRKSPNIKWGKDRGKEPQRDNDEYPWFWRANEFTGERVNDMHLTNAEKQAARK